MSEAVVARIDAGRADDLAPGTVRVVALPPEAHGLRREAIVLRDQQGVLRAYLNRCQHLPITLDAGSRAFLDRDGRELLCRTHGATYRLHDGLCTGGPCVGRSLLALPVEQQGERVWIALSGRG